MSRKEGCRLLGLALGLGVLLIAGLVLVTPPVVRGATIIVDADIAPPGVTWTTGNTYIVVTSTVSVLPGAVLTIEHGVIVKFDPNSRLFVQGQLRALGTATSGITFTAHTTAPVRGFWNGILVANNSDDNELRYCLVEYASTGLGFGDSNGNLVTHCVFRHHGDGGDTSSGGAITGVPDDTDVLYSIFYDNELGIRFQKAFNIRILHNTIHDCDAYGIGFIEGTGGEPGGGSSFIENNTITECGAEGLRLERTTSMVVRDNTIRGNVGHGIYASQQSSLFVRNNVVRNNGGDGGRYVSTQLYGGSPSIYDNIFCGNASVQFRSQHAASTITIEGNWWGTNAPVSGTHVAGNVDFTPWITLAAARAPISLPADGVSTAVITATLRDAAGHNVPDGTTITLTASLGSVSPGVVTTTAGLATATYRAGATPGLAVITATEGCGAVVTTTVLLQTADVGIRKDGGPATARPGDLITYTVTFSNSGAIPAANIRITDTLPAGAIWRSDTSASCGLTRLGTASPIVYTRPSITPSFACSFHVVVAVTETGCGQNVFNTVAITTTSPDVNAANNSDTSNTTHIRCLDLAVFKSSTTPWTMPGRVITYTVVAWNMRTEPATGVVLTERVPAHTAFVGGSACWQPAGGGVYTCAIGFLSGWAAVSRNFVVQVNSSLPPTVTGIVDVARIGDDGTHGPEMNYANNVFTLTTPISNVVDLALVKNDNVGPLPASATGARIYELLAKGGDAPGGVPWRPYVYEGDVVTYTIAYANVGTADATGVVITEVLPAHTTFVGPVGWTRVGATNVYAYSIGNLPQGRGGVIYFAVRIDSPLPPGVDTIVNRACITSAQADSDPLNNCSSDDTPVRAGYEIQVVKTSDPCGFPGRTLAYTITYQNVGSRTAPGVVIRDYLPAHTAYAGGSEWTHAGGGVYTRAVGDVPAHTGGSVQFLVRVDRPLSDTVTAITNTACISNVCATVVTPLPFEPDLAVVKNDNVGPLSAAQQERAAELSRYLYGKEPDWPAAPPECVNPGDEIVYTILYVNAGRAPAAGVVLTETLPLHTAYAGGGWTLVGGRTYRLTVGNLAVGAGWEVEFRVRVNDPLPPGVDRLINVVHIGGTTPERCHTGNNSSNDDTPVCGGAVAGRVYLPLVLKGYSSGPISPTPTPTVSPPPPLPWVSDVKANSTTGRVYVASPRSHAVHVIQDAEAGAVYMTAVPVGNYPTGLAVVTTTNKAYATNMHDWTVSVIGAGNTVIATIPVGAGPVKAAANNRFGRVYTTNYWFIDDGVTAIDSRTDTVLYHLNRTFATQGRYGIDVNPDNDKVYVAARDAGLIAIFNGDWPLTDPLVFKLDPPRVPFMVAYNPTTGHLFVTCGADDVVVVLDPAALDVKGLRTTRVAGQTVYLLDERSAGWLATIPVGDGPEEGIAVNPRTNRVYVTNMYSDSVSVLQDDANVANIRWLLDIPVGDAPQGVGVNPAFNRVYVGNAGSKTLSIINGVTNVVIQTVPLPGS